MKKKEDNFSAVEMLFIISLLLVAFVGGFVFCYIMQPEKVDTRTITVTKEVIPQGLADEVRQMKEEMFKQNLPNNPDYRLCRWDDFDCEVGKDYVEKKWYEK